MYGLKIYNNNNCHKNKNIFFSSSSFIIQSTMNHKRPFRIFVFKLLFIVFRLIKINKCNSN